MTTKPNGTYKAAHAAQSAARRDYRRAIASNEPVSGHAFRIFYCETGWGYCIEGSDWEKSAVTHSRIDVIGTDPSTGIEVCELSHLYPLRY